jgi:hypothetical protein
MHGILGNECMAALLVQRPAQELGELEIPCGCTGALQDLPPLRGAPQRPTPNG